VLADRVEVGVEGRSETGPIARQSRRGIGW
jgi:hypothetical protein